MTDRLCTYAKMTDPRDKDDADITIQDGRQYPASSQGQQPEQESLLGTDTKAPLTSFELEVLPLPM